MVRPKAKKMEALRERLREALNIIFQQLANAVDDSTRKLIANLKKARDTLEEKLTQSIQSELDQLKNDFANKTEEVAKYEALVNICNESLSTPNP